MTKHEQFLQEIQKNIRKQPSHAECASDLEKELIQKFEELFGYMNGNDEQDEDS